MYFEKNGQDYLDVAIKGADFEATGVVLVNNWDQIEGIRRTKGQSYQGAELRGLSLIIQKDAEGTNLVYNGLQEIID